MVYGYSTVRSRILKKMKCLGKAHFMLVNLWVATFMVDKIWIYACIVPYTCVR